MILTLVGYRGSGKTTVGRLLADHYEYSCIDTDSVVEEQDGRTIAEIFATDGEAEFRRLETLALKSAMAAENAIIAVGGGAVLAEENRQIMKEAGPVIWLTAPSEVLAIRILKDSVSSTQRPSLTGQAVETEVSEVLAARLPLYEAVADYRVDVSKRTPQEITAEIFQWCRHLKT